MKNKVVYRHLKPNGEVFYIGIGKTKKRAYSKCGRNRHWHNTVNKYGYEVQILKEGLSWEEACELECILIDYYGRRDLGLGPLVNMTDGGDGMLGLKHSEEAKQKISSAMKGNTYRKGIIMSEEQKLKLSEALKGKKHSEETKDKISEAMKGGKNPKAKKVICIETGKIWNTVSSCATDNGLNRTTLGKYLDGKLKNKTTFKYL